MRMLQKITLFPHYKNEQLETQARFLHIALWFTLFIAVFFAYINTGLTRLSFLALAVSSLIGLILNYFQIYILAASVPLIIGTIALFFNFYDGISLYDPGIVALPVLIILASFLFGSRMIYGMAFICIIGVALLGLLEWNGVISPPYPTSAERLSIISILIVFTAVLQNKIIGNWEQVVEAYQQSEDKLREAYVLTLEGWAKTLEFHDRETLGHSQRVTSLCESLSKKMGIIDPLELEHIRWGALLHDIGKLAVPHRILHKEDELSTEEWDVIRSHPDFAIELLGRIDYLKPALTILDSHHENWDGTGYPKQLKGEEIPLSARIFAVVDNWDALTSNRPYREAWSREKTLNYIREQSGKKFDPKIVDVFLTMMNADD